jgi:geranylgeranyl diphosphate synthase type II
MDNADKRRGKPTAHKVWNANSAILSGDAMLILAYKLIEETESPKLKEILNIFSQTSLEICEGQQYDMVFESRLDVSEAEYLEMIRLKTAVLLACSLKTGAIIGGAPEKDANHLYEFGINIGLMFQLKDDLLDVYGNTTSFGKNIGGDIACNKKTFLLINALRLANKEQSHILNEWLNKKEYDVAEKIAVISQIYDELNLKQLTEKKMEEYYQTAFLHLDKLNVPYEKTELLQSVCNQLIYRNV